jgi:hypothetical protein
MRRLGQFFWRFMVIFSFIVNIVLLVVVAVLLVTLFDIKRNIAQPLVGGLYSAFVGLEDATIDWTIPVRANVPVNLNIPLKQNTIVTLTEAVPLTVIAQITAPALSLSNARVQLELPVGLQLPVSLDLNVVVDDTLPVSLDVRAVIPLQETQLYDVAQSLQLLFEPLAVGLYNLPEDWNGAFTLVGDVLNGKADLLASNAYSIQPWPGFSRSAGYNYPLELMTAPIPPNNVAVNTGIVPLGGIPLLDEQIRPELYLNGQGPIEANAQAAAAAGIPAAYYDGTYPDLRRSILTQVPMITMTPTPFPPGFDPADLGFLPTPTP